MTVWKVPGETRNLTEGLLADYAAKLSADDRDTSGPRFLIDTKGHGLCISCSQPMYPSSGGKLQCRSCGYIIECCQGLP